MYHLFESQPFYLVSRKSPPDRGSESVSPPVSPPESVYVRESTSLLRESVSPPKISKQTSNILQHSSVLSQLLTQRDLK